MHFHAQKQRKIKFEPRIKLNHNICKVSHPHSPLHALHAYNANINDHRIVIHAKVCRVHGSLRALDAYYASQKIIHHKSLRGDFM